MKEVYNYVNLVNPFMHYVVKWPNIHWKSCGGVHTARFLKYVWPFYNMHERVNMVRSGKGLSVIVWNHFGSIGFL